MVLNEEKQVALFASEEMGSDSLPAATCARALLAFFAFHQEEYLRRHVFQSRNLIKLITFTAPARKFLCETGFFAHHNCSDKYSDFWFPLVPPAQFT